MERNRSLLTVLGRANFEKLPNDVVKKLEKVIEDVNAKFGEARNNYNESRKTVEKLRKDLHEVNTSNSNLKTTLETCEHVVSELRQQLNTLNNERSLLTERVKKEESDNVDNHKKINQLVDENNKLKEVSGRNVITISQLESDLKSLEQRFDMTLSEKNEAINRLGEMAIKEQSMDDDDKRMQIEVERLKNEILRLNNEIAKMTDNYVQASSELATAKQLDTSGVAQLDSDLRGKTEELLAAEFNIRQLTESNQQLKNQHDAETVQLKNQLNESVTLVEHYKREMDAKIKFVDLYKTQITELNEIIKETAEKCKNYESKIKFLTAGNQSELTEKNATIEELKKELQISGELLKTLETENIEKVLEKKFLRAAASNRMLKDNLTLTEIYSRYHDALDDVHRLDVECLQLNTKVECLTIQLQDTTTDFERQQIEYRKVLKLNEEMTQQMGVVVAEQDSVREKFNEVSLKLANVDNENVRLKSTQKDLARQICNLLNKVEKNGDELSSDQQQLKRMGLSNESIRKEFITFDNIVELQENNQKLILKVRELNNKVEKLEEQNIGMKSYVDKISYLERRLSDGEQARQANDEILAMTTKQKERFKQLYYDAMSYMGKQIVTEEMMEEKVFHNSDLTDNTKIAENNTNVLETEMQKCKILQEAYDEYRKQSTITFHMLKEQCESVERKMAELQSANCKLQSQANFASEQMKFHQDTIATYKKQIQILEERNQMYDKTIAKHELANKQLKEEAWNTIMQLSTAENRCGYLEMECRRLLDAKKILETENNAFHRQKMTQSILESSRDLAKLSSERSDFEGRILMEKQLEDHMRECRGENQKWKQEQERVIAENISLKREKASSICKLMEEQSQGESLRSKLTEARELIEAKNQQIAELSEKLQAAMKTIPADGSLSYRNRSSKDLEINLKKKTAEVELLNMELRQCLAKTKLLENLKSDLHAETEMLKSDLKASRLSEKNSKSHIDELQREVRVLSMKNSSSEREEKMKTELTETAGKITENNKEIQKLRHQCQQLKDSLRVVEKNYADVISAHSLDLKTSTSRKVELHNCQEQMNQLKLAKDQLEELLKARQLESEEINKKFNEDRQELERKIVILEKQIVELIELVQGRSSKVLPSSNETLNESVTNSSVMNRTLTDDEFRDYSSEKLFVAVKYFRREKDIAVAQIESLNIENTRLSAELDMQRKRVNELSTQLNSTHSPINDKSHFASSSVIEELKSNLNTLDAVTDSNIQLRLENKNLCLRIRDLTETLAGVEARLFQLQKLNQQLAEKSDTKVNENKMLRENVERLAVEREALKKECENSVKLITVETENVRLVNAENSRLKQEIDTQAMHLQTFNVQRKKLIREATEENTNILIKQDSKIVTPSQARGHKRHRDVERDSPTESALEKMLSSNKRTRRGEQIFQGVRKSGSGVEHEVPANAQQDEKDFNDEATMKIPTENFDAYNGNSFSNVEGHDIDENITMNHNNDIDDGSANAPNQSSRVSVSSGKYGSEIHAVNKKVESTEATIDGVSSEVELSRAAEVQVEDDREAKASFPVNTRPRRCRPPKRK